MMSARTKRAPEWTGTSKHDRNVLWLLSKCGDLEFHSVSNYRSARWYSSHHFCANDCSYVTSHDAGAWSTSISHSLRRFDLIAQMGRRLNDNGNIFLFSLSHSRHLLSTLGRPETELEWVDIHSIGAWISRLSHGWHSHFSSTCERLVQRSRTSLRELQSARSRVTDFKMDGTSTNT